MLFLTSDTHFGHRGILRHEPWRGAHVDEMNETIIRSWNEVVSPLDIVWHLGDIALIHKREAGHLASQLNRLNGQVHVIPDLLDHPPVVVNCDDLHTRGP